MRTAGGDGRLTAEELDARVERALSARTQGELAALVADLSATTATKDVLVVRPCDVPGEAGRFRAR